VKTKQDRQKAAKLRRKKGALTMEQRLWLASYDSSKTTQGRKPTSSAPFARAAAAVPVKRVPALPAREQLAFPKVATVQETVPPEGSIDPSSHTWVPTMPEAPADAEPAAPGTPEQPKVGTPLVGDATAAQGDPHAAKQFAGIIMFVTQVGLMHALELSATLPIPDELRAFATNQDTIIAALRFIGESAERVALKYGFRGVPLADEAVVGGAVALSALAFRANTKRKAELAARNPKQVIATPAASSPSSASESPHPTEGLNALWGSS
jgi:hypothetical protein